jgi:hypothetical protein
MQAPRWDIRLIRCFAVLTGLTVMATGCAQAGRSGPTPTTSTTGTAESPNEPSAQEPAMTPIRISIAGQSVSANLADNPTARDLAGDSRSH